jgi:hypothetical protein
MMITSVPPPGSVLGLAQCIIIPGLRCITHLLCLTEPEPEFKENNAFNHIINNDADGNFQVYYQNPCGISGESVILDHDLKALEEYDVRCYCFVETNLNWNQQ